jgi:hypothetical protein
MGSWNIEVIDEPVPNTIGITDSTLELVEPSRLRVIIDAND